MQSSLGALRLGAGGVAIALALACGTPAADARAFVGLSSGVPLYSPPPPVIYAPPPAY